MQKSGCLGFVCWFFSGNRNLSFSCRLHWCLSQEIKFLPCLHWSGLLQCVLLKWPSENPLFALIRSGIPPARTLGTWPTLGLKFCIPMFCPWPCHHPAWLNLQLYSWHQYYYAFSNCHSLKSTALSTALVFLLAPSADRSSAPTQIRTLWMPTGPRTV